MADMKHHCPPHHYIVDSQNYGRCLYCGNEKDFGEILNKGKRVQPYPSRSNSRRKKKASLSSPKRGQNNSSSLVREDEFENSLDNAVVTLEDV